MEMFEAKKKGSKACLKIKKIIFPILIFLLMFTLFAGVSPGAQATESNTLLVPCEYDELTPGNNGYYKVKKDGKFGIIDKSGVVILPLIYDGECLSRPENSDYFTATKEGKQGIVSRDGEMIVSFAFDWILELFQNEDGGFYVHGTKDGRFVVADQTGCVLSPEGHDWIFAKVYGDIAILTRLEHPMPTVSDPYHILYNLKTGETLSPPDCEYIDTADGEHFIIATKWEGILDESGNYVVTKPAQCSILNRTGEVIVPAGTFDSIGSPLSGNSFAGGYTPALKGSRLMMIDSAGTVVKELGDGFSSIGIQADGMYIVNKGDLQGVIDSTGKILLPFNYQNIEYNNGIFNATLPNGQPATLDRMGKTIVNGYAYRYKNAELLLLGDNALYDIHGKEIVPKEKYDRINLGDYGFVVVSKNGRYGILNTDGHELYPCQLAATGIASARSLIVYKDDFANGLLDISGELVVDFGKYTLYEILPSGFITAGDSGTGGHMGLLSPDGVLVIPCAYDSIQELPGGYFVASRGYDRQLFDINGNLVIETGVYQEFCAYEKGLICVKKEDKWGLLKLPGVLYRSPDSPPSNWAVPELSEAAAQYLIPEDLMGNYTQNITREEFCRLITRLYERKSIAVPEPVLYDHHPFYDVLDNADVLAAYSLGIVEGDGKGFFNPSAPITRQEAAKMLTLTAKALGMDTNAVTAAYIDNESISDWAKPGVNYVTAYGIMTGMGDGAFAPNSPYTREQAFVTMLRLWDATRSLGSLR